MNIYRQLLMRCCLIAIIGNAEAAEAVCEHTIQMKAYSICLPNNWFVEKNTVTDQVAVCNKPSDKCTGNGGGFPLAGAVFVFITPVLGNSRIAGTAKDIAQRQKDRLGSGDVVKIDLGGGNHCYRFRSLQNELLIWNEVYGLQVGSTVFRIWAQYNNEKWAIRKHRSAVLTVVKSVRLVDGVR